MVKPVTFDGISGLCDPSKQRSGADDYAPIHTKDRCRICGCGYLSRFDAPVKQAEIKGFGLFDVSAGHTATGGNGRYPERNYVSGHKAKNTHCITDHSTGNQGGYLI